MAYLEDIQSEPEFYAENAKLLELLQQDEVLFREAMQLYVKLMPYKYLYQRSWMGVPIIKLPEDIVVLQEFIFTFRPDTIIEIGVARGGGLALYASLQKMADLPPRVLGVDLKVMSHTKNSLQPWLQRQEIDLFEGDALDGGTEAFVKDFLSYSQRAFLVLDSNHTSSHVLKELEIYAKLLPQDSRILVCDGIIEYLPDRLDRPWGKDNHPGTAVKQFLEKDSNWILDKEWSRKSFFTESRDGWLRRRI